LIRRKYTSGLSIILVKEETCFNRTAITADLAAPFFLFCQFHIQIPYFDASYSDAVHNLSDGVPSSPHVVKHITM
jgi:hypothetical protein